MAEGALPQRVLLLGMDGASPDLLLRWTENGALPTLKALRSRGTTCRLESPPGCGDDGAWATAYTGVSPATHGRFYYRRLQPGTYGLPTFTDSDLRHAPLWNTLARAGKRVAVIDVPKSPVPGTLNGVYLGDWLVHGRDHATPVAYPDQFARDTMDRFGQAPQSLCGFSQPSLDAAGYNDMLERLRISTGMKRDLCLSLLAQEPWDLLFAVFKEAHCAGHHGWHLHDRSHANHAPDVAALTGDPLLRAYQEIDTAIGDLIAHGGSDMTVVVFTALGMGPNNGMAKLLPEILERLSPGGRPRGASLRRLLKPIAASLIRRAGARSRAWLRRVSGAVGTGYRTGQSAFAIEPSEHVSGIRLNLAGREANGLIQPGTVADRFCEQLTRDLLDIVDPETGEPLIDDVVPIGELYDGPLMANLPDLVVFWNLSRRADAAASSKIGVVAAPASTPRTGAHVPGGLLIAAGGGLAKGELIPARPLVDLAATIGALLEVELSGCEGTPIPRTTDHPAARTG